MEKIYLSDAGPKVSPAIYGFWRWNEVSAENEMEMEKMVNFCLEKGINTFDHADTYGDYACEEIFGNVLAKKSFKREDIVLFTKCGLLVPNPKRPDIKVEYVDSSSAHILKSVDNSLKKLRTDYIDIFLLDHLDHLANLEDTALTLERLKASGKIKYIGVANFSVFQHQLLSSYLKLPIVTNHMELNLLNTTALDNGQIDYTKQRYMRPIAAAPLAGGLIESGEGAQALKVKQKLEAIAAKYDTHIESVATAWLIKLGALPLIGTHSEQRIINIVNAFGIDLEKQDWYDLYNTAKGK